MNRLVRYFPNADLRAGYDGLSKFAAKEGIDLMNLPKGHFVAFVNTARNKLKLCTQNDVVAYLRLQNRTIDPRVIQHLPNYFNGASIEYDKAMTRVLAEAFPKWFQKQNTNSKGK